MKPRKDFYRKYDIVHEPPMEDFEGDVLSQDLVIVRVVREAVELVKPPDADEALSAVPLPSAALRVDCPRILVSLVLYREDEISATEHNCSLNTNRSTPTSRYSRWSDSKALPNEIRVNHQYVEKLQTPMVANSTHQSRQRQCHSYQFQTIRCG